MIEAGIVLTAESGRATVRMTRTAACAECGMCHGLAHPARDLVLSAENRPDARPGDLVRVQVPDLGVVKAAFWAYGVPTIGAVAGGILGWQVAGAGGLSTESGAALGGTAGIVAGFYVVSRFDRWLRGKWRGPTIVEVLTPRDQGMVETHNEHDDGRQSGPPG
jgi:sigma-E factor negative regulatory protein RseC